MHWLAAGGGVENQILVAVGARGIQAVRRNGVSVGKRKGGKGRKKCSTSGGDKRARKATGCPYVNWLKAGEAVKEDTGEEFLPPEAN